MVLYQSVTLLNQIFNVMPMLKSLSKDLQSKWIWHPYFSTLIWSNLLKWHCIKPGYVHHWTMEGESDTQCYRILNIVFFVWWLYSIMWWWNIPIEQSDFVSTTASHSQSPVDINCFVLIVQCISKLDSLLLLQQQPVWWLICVHVVTSSARQFH